MRKRFWLLLVVAGCAPRAPAAAPQPAIGPGAADTAALVPNAVHWYRNSMEYRAIALEVYRQATEQVIRQAAGLPAGSWAVIMDADETLLDTSEYQRRTALQGTSFNTTTWNAWIRAETAPAVPGGPEFAQAVQRLGGRVVIVTGRDQAVCPQTEANLRALGVMADAVLCQTDRTSSDKNPRFRAVAAGTTPAGLPPLRVLAWVGDNIRDFPDLNQNVSGEALQPFGTRYFMLPNPMYGSWERLPRR